MIEQKIVQENIEELEKHLAEGWLIKTFSPKGSVILERSKKLEAQELKAEELVNPPSPFDELSDEEVLYYASPYFDEIQARKQAREEQLKEELNQHG